MILYIFHLRKFIITCPNTLHCFYLQVVRGHTGGGGGTHSYHHVSSRVTGGSGGVSDYELPLSAHSLGTSSLAGGAGYGGAGAGLGGAGLGRAGAGHHHTPSYHRLPVSHFSHSSLLSLFISKIKSYQTLFLFISFHESILKFGSILAAKVMMPLEIFYTP